MVGSVFQFVVADTGCHADGFPSPPLPSPDNPVSAQRRVRTTAPYWQQLYARDFGDRLHAAASPWRGSRREVGSKTIAAPATSLTLHAASGVDVDGDDGAYVAYADAVRQHRGEVQVGGDLVCTHWLQRW